MMSCVWNIDSDIVGRVPHYSSHGCYPCYAVVEVPCGMATELESWCPCCVNEVAWEIPVAFDERYETPVKLVSIEVNWENASLYCARCEAEIESAYAEKDS